MCKLRGRAWEEECSEEKGLKMKLGWLRRDTEEEVWC